MRSDYRLTGLGHWIGEEQTTGHATIWNKATKNCPVLLMLQDSSEPTICPSPKLGIQIPSRDDWDNINNTICQNGIIWFTDGSKIGDKAGAGVYGKTTRTKLSFALGSYASVFQAEIYAILACGIENLKTAPKRRTIQICTDSQAALMAIESSKVKSRLVLDCKKILNDLASCNRVILTWVSRGNEEADRLARLGSIGYPIGPEPILGVPYSMGGLNHERAPKQGVRKIMARSRRSLSDDAGPVKDVCDNDSYSEEEHKELLKKIRKMSSRRNIYHLTLKHEKVDVMIAT
ncbi:hypothetical protein NQ318_016404 [Aromia moschata]|uniref:RNase H type-1 domain-containing protein n=1 Tax=Aromia moschata TaxID=1265417 RepID=A0AAV8Z5N3_9CUCU|nr:hypothetical protein NQ318_016404 [Aromia moschata]